MEDYVKTLYECNLGVNLISTGDKDLLESINVYPDFPKKGIHFLDINPVLLNPTCFLSVVAWFRTVLSCCGADVLVAQESRGYFFATPLAWITGFPIIPVRKQGKLPGEVYSEHVKLEYGETVTELQKLSTDKFKGKKALIIDDLLATGGTLTGSVELCRKAGLDPVACAVLIQLKDLFSSSDLLGVPIYSRLSIREQDLG